MTTPVYIDIGLTPRVKLLTDPQPCRHARVKLEPGELGSVGVLCECGYFKQVQPVVVQLNDLRAALGEPPL